MAHLEPNSACLSCTKFRDANRHVWNEIRFSIGSCLVGFQSVLQKMDRIQIRICGDGTYYIALDPWRIDIKGFGFGSHSDFGSSSRLVSYIGSVL